MNWLTPTKTLKPGDIFCYTSLPDGRGNTPALLVKTEWANGWKLPSPPRRPWLAGALPPAGLEHLGGVLLVDPPPPASAGRVGLDEYYKAKAGEEFALLETVIHLGSIEWNEGPELTAIEIVPGTIFVYNGKLFVCAVPGNEYLKRDFPSPFAYYEFESGSSFPLLLSSSAILSSSATRPHPGTGAASRRAWVTRKFQTLLVNHCKADRQESNERCMMGDRLSLRSGPHRRTMRSGPERDP